MRFADGWPWWIVPWYFGLKLIHFVLYPVATLPFELMCHKDLWGNEPPYSCLSYHCPKVDVSNCRECGHAGNFAIQMSSKRLHGSQSDPQSRETARPLGYRKQINFRKFYTRLL